MDEHRCGFFDHSGGSRTNKGASDGRLYFSISQVSSRAQVIGINESADRASVMTQPDSPLAILSADFGSLIVNAGIGWFERSGRHVLDVKNVSDKVITRARVVVMVGFGPRSGVGSGFKLDRPLAPGEQTRLEWKSGSGRGSEDTDEDVSVVALVDEVQMPECVYRPSQAWPNLRGARPASWRGKP